MEINNEALRQAILDVKECCFLTAETTLEVNQFIKTGDFNLFSDGSCKELSLLFENIILPAYQKYTHGEYLPNIFIRIDN